MKHFLLIIFICVLMPGCKSGSEKINFGEEECVYCRMTISNPKFGALLITDKGRMRKYDAVECMVNDIQENDPSYQKLLVVVHDDPEKLREADSVFFAISKKYRSPMGANLAAFLSANSIPDSIKILSWSEVVRKIAIE